MLVRILIVFLLAPSLASAGKREGQYPAVISVRAITAGGIPKACSIEFTAMAADLAYAQGDVVGITGSLLYNINAANQSFGTLLKVVTSDVGSDGYLRLFKASTAHIALAGTSLLSDTSFECENQSATCNVFAADKTLRLVEHFMKPAAPTSIRYNRRPGGMDVDVALPPLTQVDLNSLQDCLLAMLGTVQAEKEKEPPPTARADR